MKKLFTLLLIAFCLQANAQSGTTITSMDGVADSSNYCTGVAYTFEANPSVWYSYRWSTTPSGSTFGANNGTTFPEPVITFTTSGTYTINLVYGTSWGGNIASTSKVVNVVSGNCAATGIAQVDFTKKNISIYPNPAQNNFTVEVSTNDKQTLNVFDINGKQILSQIITGTTNIDVSNLAAGIYNLSITNNYGVTNKRLVIVK